MFEITVTGNLARDPVLKEVNGKEGPTKVCNLVVAGNRRGEKDPVFVSVALWGRRAEIFAPMLQKGSKVFARGEGTIETYEGKNGWVGAPKILSVEAFDAMGNLRPKQDQPSQTSSKPSPDDIPF